MTTPQSPSNPTATLLYIPTQARHNTLTAPYKAFIKFTEM